MTVIFLSVTVKAIFNLNVLNYLRWLNLDRLDLILRYVITTFLLNYFVTLHWVV